MAVLGGRSGADATVALYRRLAVQFFHRADRWSFLLNSMIK